MRQFIFFLLLICPMQIVFGAASQPPVKTESLTVEGIVRMVGNEPFTYLTVRNDQNRDYRIPASERSKLLPALGNTVKITGQYYRFTAESADHKYKIIEHYLTNIQVLTVKTQNNGRPKRIK